MVAVLHLHTMLNADFFFVNNLLVASLLIAGFHLRTIACSELGAINAHSIKDLKKAYNALKREQTLNILAAYGFGPRMLRLQKHFTHQNWCAAPGVITGSLVMLRGALLTGAHLLSYA